MLIYVQLAYTPKPTGSVKVPGHVACAKEILQAIENKAGAKTIGGVWGDDEEEEVEVVRAGNDSSDEVS